MYVLSLAGRSVDRPPCKRFSVKILDYYNRTVHSLVCNKLSHYGINYSNLLYRLCSLRCAFRVLYNATDFVRSSVTAFRNVAVIFRSQIKIVIANNSHIK